MRSKEKYRRAHGAADLWRSEILQRAQRYELFQLRNRILSLEEYFHSLESLVKAEVYNPAKRRAWNSRDAKERWEEVKKQAQDDKRKCEFVQSLPKLEKQLQELQAAAEKKE